MEAVLARMIAAVQAAAQAAQALVQVAHQQLQAQQQAAAARQPVRGPRIDGRSIEKPKRFIFQDVDFEDREFPEWRFTFTSWLGVQDPTYREEMGNLDTQTTVVDDTAMSAEMKVRSIAHRAHDGAALEVGPEHAEAESLLALMAPQERVRSLGMLQHLMSAELWRGDKDYWEKVPQWGTDVDRYEKSSGRPFPEELKVAAVLRNAPREVRPQLSLRVTSSTTYEQLWSIILGSLQALKTWDIDFDRSDPMDVGQVSKSSGKGKFQGTCNVCGKVGHKTADCWYPNSDGKGKGKSKGRGRGKAQGAGKGASGAQSFGKASKKLEGECRKCGKWGHKAADCRSKAVNQVSQPSEGDKSSASSVSGTSDARPRSRRSQWSTRKSSSTVARTTCGAWACPLRT